MQVMRWKQYAAAHNHRVSVNYPDAMNATVTLANGTARLNADLVLEWQTAVGQSPKAQLFEEKTKDGYFSFADDQVACQ